MARSSSGELVEGYIEEVKTYLPSLTEGIDTLREEPGQTKVLEEVHRLVHTIKGASSMIGIYGLSHIAYQMEEALDDIISGKLSVTEEAIDAMSHTIEQFRTYCTDYQENGVKARDMLRETVLAFRRVRNLSQAEDEPVLKELLDTVPEKEGGKGDKDEGSGDEDQDFFVPETDSGEDDDMPFIGEDELPGMDDMEYDELPVDIGDDPEEDAGEVPEAPEIMPELLESFNEEAEEHIEELQRSLSMLESGITRKGPLTVDQKEALRRIRRAVHTVKGAAAVIGLPNISAFAHGYEDLLDWIYEGDRQIGPETVTVLVDSADLLERIVADPRDAKAARARMLKERYEEIMGGASEGESQAVHAPFPESDSEPESEEEAETEMDMEDDAMDVIPELVESFNEEAREHLDEMGRSLNVLEAEIMETTPISAPHREIIRKIRRSVHTVKGAAAVIGLKNISAFAHGFEDLLDWMFEEAGEISPALINILADSSDLLESIVADPTQPRKSRADELRAVYKKVMGQKPSKPVEKPKKTEAPKKSGSVEILESPKAVEEEEIEMPGPAGQTKTLRVGMERVDELVNLAGELIIALSGFDQKMDAFIGSVGELDISRNRLRDLAREMEVGYEVKALAQWDNSGPASLSRGFHSVSEGADEGFGDFDTLELDRYSELSLIIRQLNESVIDVGAIHTHLSNLYSEFDGHLTRQRVLLSELQDKVMRVRMTPMATITNRLRRTVRDTARKLGKKIRLVIQGENIELDRLVWDKITDPLMHMLRNAADHGIEPPALRQALGKPPVATVKLAASREGNQVVIRISDDGAGINYEAIRKKAREAGILGKTDEVAEDELANLIFQPGFSTRGKISEISGRGVGMDVVKENIQDLKGVVRVAAWKGKGTTFTVRIPLTLAAVRALLFYAGGQIFAIALNEINEIMRLSPKNFIREPENAVRIGDEILPLFYMTRTLDIRKDDSESSEMRSIINMEPVVLVVQTGGRRGALVVDSLVGQKEIVIKSMGSHLRYVKGISGVTIMGDGSVIPILNIEELFLSQSTIAEVSSGGDPLKEKPLEILVVDDSVSIRTVVSRLMEDQGWKVRTAKDGIDALEKVREETPDFIVLDIEMPRMNGYEFLSALRTQPSYRNVPVAMLTSRTAAKHREKAISLGAMGFIVKPYNDDEFVNLVLELTDRSR